ncbi:MAG TPA: leucine zipper domain-containing protein [Marmoricola sp.]|nr:leucine zipper domain-containing protein [Marmoricola sp.]
MVSSVGTSRADDDHDVSWPTAKRWVDRYRFRGPAGLNDGSSRPHHSPAVTRAPVVRKIVHPRWKLPASDGHGSGG